MRRRELHTCPLRGRQHLRQLLFAERLGDEIDKGARLGFAPIYPGGANEGRLVQFPGGPLAVLNLVKFD